MTTSDRPQSPAAAAPEENPTDSPLQCLLKKERVARGFSSQAMSRAIGLNDQAYCNYEKGSAVPSESSWEKIRRFLAPVPPSILSWRNEQQSKPALLKNSFTIPENANPVQVWLLKTRKTKGLTKSAIQAPMVITKTARICLLTFACERLPMFLVS